jgi:type III secretory pathway component EscU
MLKVLVRYKPFNRDVFQTSHLFFVSGPYLLGLLGILFTEVVVLVNDILGYKMMIDKLKIEDDKINQELEDSHGDPNRMKVALEKRINLYKRFFKQDDLSNLDRISLKIKENGLYAAF